MKRCAFMIFFLTCVSQIMALEQSQHKTAIFLPFDINIDPMERLLLLGIENDPDSIYIGFEPQFFNDTINGTGLLILAWRSDGAIDVYHQPSLQPDPDKYDIAGKGLSAMLERELEGSYFYVNENGAQVKASFSDKYGRNIEFHIEEKSTRKRRPFDLLAPMGYAAENPSSLPVLYMHDFYFVRKKNTSISVTINQRSHIPNRLAIPMDRQKMYFARYCPDPVIATVNTAFTGQLEPIIIGSDNIVKKGNTVVDLENKNDLISIKSLTNFYKEHQVQLSFDPPIPDISVVSTNDRYSGNFTIIGRRQAGIIQGDYRMEYSEEGIYITMIPSKGWKPARGGKLSVRCMYAMVKFFKQWPTTYQWNALIQPSNDGGFTMQSNWQRINNN